jgi:hypothetical protein
LTKDLSRYIVVGMKNRKTIPVTEIIPQEVIERKIFIFRGKRVMLDTDLAALYGVEVKRLNEQVRRNSRRFPVDFMFQLNTEEFNTLRSHFATTNRGGRRYYPYVFTEQGVAMLSSVLNSDKAIDVNIAIMRAFVRLREILASHKELRDKIEAMAKKYDQQFQIVFDAIDELITPPQKPARKIGFHP